jgi:hypothetical protein
VYVTSDTCVFRLEHQNGVLTRIARTSRAGDSGDGGPAINAQLRDPREVAIDAAGNLFIVDFGNLAEYLHKQSGEKWRLGACRE